MGANQSQEADQSAWRATAQNGGNMEWTEATEKTLREYILRASVQATDPLVNTDGKKMVILMLGTSKAGKSAFINSLFGALSNKLLARTFSGSADLSVTQVLLSICYDGDTELQFKLQDSPGLLENRNEPFYRRFVELLLQGKIKEDYEVPIADAPIDSQYLVENPDKMDVPCIVVIVLRAGKEIAEERVLMKNLSIIKAAAGKNLLKVVVLLTCADLASQDEKNPVKNNDADYIYYSRAVRDAVLKAANQTGVPVSSIYPVTNYTDQQCTYTKMNILHLYTFSKLLDEAVDEARKRMRSN